MLEVLMPEKHAISILKKDHDTVKDLFDLFEKAKSPRRGYSSFVHREKVKGNPTAPTRRKRCNQVAARMENGHFRKHNSIPRGRWQVAMPFLDRSCCHFGPFSGATVIDYLAIYNKRVAFIAISLIS